MRSRLFRRRLRKPHPPVDQAAGAQHGQPASRERGRRPEDDAAPRRYGATERRDARAEEGSGGKSGPTIRYTFRRHWKRPQDDE